MTSFENSRGTGVDLDEIDFPLLASETRPLRNSGRGAGVIISDYAAAAVILAGSVKGTSAVLAPSETERLMPISHVTALAEGSWGGATGIQLGVGKVDSMSQVVRKGVSKIKSSRLELSDSITKLIRVPYVSQMLAALKKMEEAIGEPRSAVHAEKVFNAIQTLSEVSPYDPFVRILLAFYDSLAFQNRWNSYSKEQYAQARAILESATEKGALNDPAVNKAIMELEGAGFSTLPFEVDYVEES